MDEDGIRGFARTLLTNDIIARLRIDDDQGRAVFAHLPESTTPLIYRRAVVRHGSDRIGTVELGITTRPLQVRRRQMMILAAALTGAVLLTMSLAGLIMIRYAALRPLKQLTTGIQSAGRGDYSYTAQGIVQEELLTIAEEFEGMVRQIHQRESQLTCINEQLQR
jgi:methyl-accepting chemotaxis protein